MRMMALLAILLGALAQAPAHAEMRSGDGISFDLQLPDGFCALSRTHPKEKAHYALQDRMQAQVNAVLMIAVGCDEVDAARAGRPWKRWAMWLLNGKPGHHTKVPEGMGRADVVRELSKAMPRLDMDTVKKQIDDAAGREGLQLKLRNVSVVDKDDDALYTGQTVAVNTGAVRREIAVVTGWLSLQQRILTLNVYTDYKDTSTIDTLLAQAKTALMGTLNAATSR